MKELQIELTDDNALDVVAYLEHKILARRLQDKEFVSFGVVSDDITTTDIELWLTNGWNVSRVPYFLEINPTLKTVNVPNKPVFTGRTVDVTDEDGNVTGTRVLKVHEYFRYLEADGRLFIELVNTPKRDSTVVWGTIDVVDWMNINDIQVVLDTFTNKILNSYAKKEFAELREELNVVEE